MKITRNILIEISLVIILIVSVPLLLFALPIFSYPLVLSGALLALFWFYQSFNRRYFDRVPWFAFIFSVPLAMLPVGLSMKLSILEGGAFILFIGLVLAVIAISVIFFLVLTMKDYLAYLKNVSFRLVPMTTLGIIIYFTPQMEIIHLVYSSDQERIEYYKEILEHPYSSKQKKRTIAFVSNRNGGSDIFEINTDGTGLKELVSGPRNEWSPRVNADGTFLYFLSDRDSVQALYKKNLRNDSIFHIKDIVFDDFYFQLHPYDDKIVSHDTIKGFFQVFIHDLKSGDVRQITFDSCNSKKPVYFHDGDRILFQSDCSGNSDIYMLNLLNDSLVNLTNSESSEQNPMISPFDDAFVFHSDRDSLKRINLYYQIIESGEIGQLTNSPGMELVASFSPDAKNLVFGSNRDDNWEVYLMSNEGEFKDRLTNHPSFDGDAIYIERSYVKK